MIFAHEVFSAMAVSAVNETLNNPFGGGYSEKTNPVLRFVSLDVRCQGADCSGRIKVRCQGELRPEP